ncbi:hypothetical protein TCAL_14706 [Tigriopus californicus]|uniref:RING-type domain-containing protein n=1 Tax=Tigriopus californicus TaxID=6832 RepID=A0A553PGX7_TIGCA|nr:uncharacterized protein LOC131880724 [Tigriopus californicus]TRY76940.1 hypothetical protein TCAL_14706 [Tigriopus californicus]
MMAIDVLLRIVNGLGGAVTRSLTTLISLNHRLCEVVVGCVSWVLVLLGSWMSSILLGIRISLEDLSLFLSESLESLLSVGEFVGLTVDHLCQTLISCFGAIQNGFGLMGKNVLNLYETMLRGSGQIWSGIVHCSNLLGASIILLLQLVPRTVSIILTHMGQSLQRALEACFQVCQRVAMAFKSTPVEMFIGLTSGVMISYLSYRLVRKLVRDHEITPRWLLETTFRLTLFVYINFVRGALALILGVAQGVSLVLSHMHVPQFHHAGDSDPDEEEEPGALPYSLDDSDPEDQERQTRKRRNYDRLLLRREARLRRNLLEDDEDVEDLLFEQVEREREDKLCVICQDQEKCIMILPCRHLCICQGCQGALLQAQNKSCPICRRMVRQTIKAYL